jgi:hypothetical protein
MGIKMSKNAGKMLEKCWKNAVKCRKMPNILQHIASADSCCFYSFWGCFTGDKLVSGIILTNPNLFLPFIPMQKLQPKCD